MISHSDDVLAALRDLIDERRAQLPGHTDKPECYRCHHESDSADPNLC
jgi:hypothetical protein